MGVAPGLATSTFSTLVESAPLMGLVGFKVIRSRSGVVGVFSGLVDSSEERSVFVGVETGLLRLVETGLLRFTTSGAGLATTLMGSSITGSATSLGGVPPSTTFFGPVVEATIIFFVLGIAAAMTVSRWDRSARVLEI